MIPDTCKRYIPSFSYLVAAIGILEVFNNGMVSSKNYKNKVFFWLQVSLTLYSNEQSDKYELLNDLVCYSEPQQAFNYLHLLHLLTCYYVLFITQCINLCFIVSRSFDILYSIDLA